MFLKHNNHDNSRKRKMCKNFNTFLTLIVLTKNKTFKTNKTTHLAVLQRLHTDELATLTEIHRPVVSGYVPTQSNPKVMVMSMDFVNKQRANKHT